MGYTQLLRPGTAYSTALGESKSVALPDGTRVALNTTTQLRARVTGDARTVWLESGEAYFEVTHDAKRPFVVEAGTSRVTVLGTKFTVRRDGDQVKVAVVDGRVTVGPVGASDKTAVTVIARNDVLLAHAGQMDVAHLKPEQLTNQLGWRQGKLVLDDFTLEQAAAEFNRYNRLKLVVADATAGQIRIGGSFNMDNVEGFAHLLQTGFGLRVEIGKDEIRILR
jgi:transmembrane sensor